MARFSAIVVLLVLAMLLGACGGGLNFGTPPPPPPPPPFLPAFVYISNTSASTLTGINVSGGKPTQLATSLPPPGAAPIGMVATGKLLYVANSGSGTISGFSFNADSGALQTLPGSPATAAPGVRQLALCPGNSGGATPPKFLYAAADSGVLGYNITGTGQLTPVAGSPFTAGAQPAAVLTDSACNFLFVASKGSNSISVFSVNLSNGFLTPVFGSPFLAGAAPVALAMGDGFLFAANSASNNVSVYTISSGAGSGTFLTQVPGSPFSAGFSPSALVYQSPTLYVANSGSGDVSAFTTALNTGRLTPVVGSPFMAGSLPMAMIAFSPPASNVVQQSFLYVANAGSSTLSGFTISANGALTVAPGFPFPAGPNPQGLVFACGHCGYP
ncbi:MAG TPA: beta-propeller fold lactonase family protein [Terriglobales bacterium]|nr:beta-propeller fold lactonase family protein [Terriglobales bacterium]